VSGCFQSGAQLRVIKNFAIIDDLQAAIFIAHRLMPARHINDAQTPVPKRGKIVTKEAAAVRPPVRNPIRHRSQQIPVYILIRRKKTRNSAHRVSKEPLNTNVAWRP
jgi:hypothetical protein